MSKPVPLGAKPRNPFPVTARDEPVPIDPADEPTRAETAKNGVTVKEFMERSRRYFRLTHRGNKLQYARGLETKPKDFA